MIPCIPPGHPLKHWLGPGEAIRMILKEHPSFYKTESFLFVRLTYFIRGPEMDDALKSFLIFALILALAGTIIALAWYFGLELPVQQAALYAPPNNGFQTV